MARSQHTSDNFPRRPDLTLQACHTLAVTRCLSQGSGWSALSRAVDPMHGDPRQREADTNYRQTWVLYLRHLLLTFPDLPMFKACSQLTSHSFSVSQLSTQTAPFLKSLVLNNSIIDTKYANACVCMARNISWAFYMGKIKESYHMALPRSERVRDPSLHRTDLHQSETSSVSHSESRLPFAAIGSTGHFASMSFTALSSQLGGGETWQCWCLSLVTVTSPPFLPQSYSPRVPCSLFPSSNLSFPLPCQCSQSHHCRIHLLSPLPSPPVHPGLSPSLGLGPFHHQAVLQPHARFPFCHALCSLLSPQPLRLQLSVLLCSAITQLGKGDL